MGVPDRWRFRAAGALIVALDLWGLALVTVFVIPIHGVPWWAMWGAFALLPILIWLILPLARNDKKIVHSLSLKPLRRLNQIGFLVLVALQIWKGRGLW